MVCFLLLYSGFDDRQAIIATAVQLVFKDCLRWSVRCLDCFFFATEVEVGFDF